MGPRVSLFFTIFVLVCETSGFAAGISFQSHDDGPARTPYACSFHWLNSGTQDLTFGIDVVRSDNQKKEALRFFVIEPTGTIHGFVKEAPSTAWQTFQTQQKPQFKNLPVLGRGVTDRGGWVAGSAAGPDYGDISSVQFDLDFSIFSKGLQANPLFSALVFINATDYMDTATTGWVKIDGDFFKIGQKTGPVSSHFGAKLSDYGYIITSPGEGPQVLLSAVDKSNFKINFIGSKTVTYGHGGVADGIFKVADFKKIVEFKPISIFEHKLLGERTLTGTGAAVLHFDGQNVDLGRVIFDLRGEGFTHGF